MLYDSFGGPLQLGVVLILLSFIEPQKQDRKQSIKTKTIGPSVFTLIYFPDVRLSVCPFFRIFGCSLISHELLDMHIIRTGSMRRLKLSILFVVSTYISRVINENVRKMAKTKIQNLKFTSQTIYHLVGHDILNKTLYFVKRYFSQNLRYLRKYMKNLISSNELNSAVHRGSALGLCLYSINTSVYRCNDNLI